MKFTINWLKNHLETTASNQEIIEKLTSLGLEVEEVTDKAESLKPFTIAEIQEAEKHPDADRLKVCKVNTGSEVLQIVCGAPNARAGIKVVLAPIGSIIPNGGFAIKKGVIRGVESSGMLCSGAELGVSADGEGIIELKTEAPVGTAYAKAYGLDDCLIEIAITPNRQDCLGVYGIARDLAAAGLGKLKTLNTKAPNFTGNSPVAVDIQDKNCEQFTGIYIEGVNNTKSPDWLVQRLTSIGQKSISALVDITNFICFDLGRPLHVYDADKIAGKLTIKAAQEGEKLKALDEKTYTLTGTETIICDGSNTPQALAGVIGGQESGCLETTKNVFLEVAYFNPVSVAKAGRKHSIITDSRYRFERGVDPNFIQDASHIATQLILDICGGKASKPVIIGQNKQDKKSISFNTNLVKTFGGLAVEQNQCQEILSNLGFDVTQNEELLNVSVPSWRQDVIASADLVEEILRIKGYNAIPMQELPSISSIDFKQDYTTQEKLNYALSSAKRKLVSNGMNEVVTWSFSNSKLLNGFLNNSEKGYYINNPISAELDQMRPSILPNMLIALKNNINRGNKTMRAFEAGPIFNSSLQSKDTVIGEIRNLSGILSGNSSERNIYDNPEKLDVFHAKAMLIDVISGFGFNTAKIQVKTEAPSYYHPGKAGCFALGKNILGYFGELHPSILKQFGIKQQVAAFECLYQNIPAAKNKNNNRGLYQPSNLQEVERDFAFVIDKQHSFANLKNTIMQSDPLISQANIFDIFVGTDLNENEQSVAFNVKLTPKDKTLGDVDIDNVVNKIIANLGAKFGAKLRG